MDLISILFLVINLMYWIFLFRHLAVYEAAGSDIKNREKVLVTICVRNEAKNIKRFLPLILEQEYKSYMILVVDDLSIDNTQELLTEFKQLHNNIDFVVNDKHLGKKRSIHTSLINRNEPVLVFTDGDCRANSSRWIELMTNSLNSGKEIVLGYGPFFKHPSFINKFARFECIMTAIQYFSFALSGIPYMGVGRNLAYKKKLFDKQGGYSSHINKLSGDDDLFINQVATSRNTGIQLDPDSFMYSESPKSIKSFFRQKRRHISTASSYKLIHQLLLTLFALSQIMFYVGLVFLNLQTIIWLILLRMAIIMPLAYLILNKLKEKDLFIWFPLFDFLFALYYVIMSILGILPRQKKW